MILAALALGMLVVPIGPSGAHHGDLLSGPIIPSADEQPYMIDESFSWTNCSWNRESRFSLRVAQSSFYPFPNDNTAADTGAPQSFRQRINDAMGRWRAVYSNASPKPKSLVKVSDGAENEILFQYRAPSSSQFIGETFVRRTQDSTVSSFGPRCALRATAPRHQLFKVQIRIRKLSDWFTQPDGYVTAWESCTNTSTYTCSKTFDFQSLVTHELGHAFGLRHTEETKPFPSEEDGGTYHGCATSSQKGSPTQPTMCHLTPSYTGWKRTPESHDEANLHKHVEKNG